MRSWILAMVSLFRDKAVQAATQLSGNFKRWNSGGNGGLVGGVLVIGQYSPRSARTHRLWPPTASSIPAQQLRQLGRSSPRCGGPRLGSAGGSPSGGAAADRRSRNNSAAVGKARSSAATHNGTRWSHQSVLLQTTVLTFSIARSCHPKRLGRLEHHVAT